MEAAGEGLADACATPRRSPPARAACCTAPCPRCSRTRRGRSSRRTRSPPGSTTRASGPEHAYLRDTGRVRYVAVADDDALAAFRRDRPSWRGSCPRSSRAHAIAWLLANPVRGHLAGHALRARRQGPGRGAGASECAAHRRIDRIASAFAGHGKRAALMPYLMGGFPDLDASLAAGEAAADAGRRPDRARHPLLRPAGRRARDPRRRAPRALAAGATPHGVLRRVRAALRAAAGGADGLRERGARRPGRRRSRCGPRPPARPG